MYTHTILVFTLPLVGVAITPLPSTLSVHVAHCSTYVLHWAIVIVAFPLNVTIGALWSVTLTVLVTTFPVFHALSTFMYCT